MSAPYDPAAPCMRLFLSVDLVGSTRLKNVLNQQRLWRRFRAASAAVEAIVTQCGLSAPNEAAVSNAILSSLEVGTVEFDWASVIEAFYDDFHTEFRARLKEATLDMQLARDWPAPDADPWKAIGDELIYVFDVCSRRQIHWTVIAFLAALRTIDGNLPGREGDPEHHGLRLKGSGWVAGFPVRNRRVKLPGTTPAVDYLGPEIDTGFRIGRCTQPGMLAVSVELAELLAEIPTTLRPMTGMIVGWERLKGVWQGRHYSIIWIDMPDGHLPDLLAERFDDWELQESLYSREWADTIPPKPNMPELHEHLAEIRNRLPSELGIVDPYILVDPDSRDAIPDSHREIQELLLRVTAFQNDASRQDAESTADAANTSEEEIDSIVDNAVSSGDEPTS